MESRHVQQLELVPDHHGLHRTDGFGLAVFGDLHPPLDRGVLAHRRRSAGFGRHREGMELLLRAACSVPRDLNGVPEQELLLLRAVKVA